MNLLVVLGHPQPGSFNHAIADAVCVAARKNGHSVTLHDLYADRFDPCLPAAEIADDGPLPDAIRKHCAELQQADGIVIVHPNWWGHDHIQGTRAHAERGEAPRQAARAMGGRR